MPSDDVVEAVRDGKFSIWAVADVDQGIEILTGTPAGERADDGEYPAGTIHNLVAQKLRSYSDLQAVFGAGRDGRASRALSETAAKAGRGPKTRRV